MIDYSTPYLIPHDSPTERIAEDHFITAYDSLAEQNCLLGIRKIRAMNVLIRQVREARIVGEVAELGVYKGGAARFLARSFTDKTCMLFDTFTGMPESSEIDFHKAGEFSDTSLDKIKALLSDCPNVFYCEGFFPESAKPIAYEWPCAFVHLDGDLYQSIKDGLEFFYPRMSKGGVIVIDDYEWQYCEGVKKAVQEFMADKPEPVQMAFEYQAYIVKQ